MRTEKEITEKWDEMRDEYVKKIEELIASNKTAQDIADYMRESMGMMKAMNWVLAYREELTLPC